LSHPAAVFEANGIDFDIASPIGGKAPMDEGSRDLSDPFNRRFLDIAENLHKLESTLRAEDVNPNDYAAIFYAGGHGTMWDFPENAALSTLAQKIYERGGIVAAVCHGPAALVNIRLSDKSFLIDGKNLTGFSNAEETAAGLEKVMPFLLEDRLRARGAAFTNAPLWQSHVVTDGRLVTGQNPASADGVSRSVAALLALKN
jgi:putative intracellular protease/amidase